MRLPILPAYEDTNPDEFDLGLDEAPATSAAVEQAAVAPQQAPAILPAHRAAVPQAQAQASGDPYEELIKEREKGVEDALHFVTSDKDGSKLVSGAPEWYKGGPPPDKNNWAGPLAGMAAGVLTGPREVAMQNPLRPMGMKMKDAQGIAMANGLAGLVGGLVNKKSDAFDREQAAAGKEAAMMKVLPGGSRSSQALSGAEKLLDSAHKSRAEASVGKLREHNISKDEMMNSTDEETVPQLGAMRRALAEIYTNRGMPVPDLTGTSMNQIQHQLSLFNSDIKADSSERSADARAQNARSQASFTANETRATQVAKQKNEAAALRAQMGLGDDYVAVAPISGDSKTRDDIREAATTRDTMLDDLKRMKEIQHELNAMGRGFTGAWNNWMAGLEGTPEGEKAQALKLEADAIQHDLMTQERGKARSNMGVPQQFELQLVKNLYPAAGDPMAWIRGDHPWDAMEKTIDRTTYNYLKKRGIGLKSKSDQEGAVFEPDAQPSPVAPVVSARAHGGSTAAPMGGELSLPPAVEAAVQAHEKGQAPLPKVNEVLHKPAPKLETAAPVAPAAAPAITVNDAQKAKVQAVVKQIEAAIAAGKKLTVEQAARLDALRKQAQ